MRVWLYERSILILVTIKKLKVVVRIPHHRFMWLVDKMSWTLMKLSAWCIGSIVVWTFSVTSHHDVALSLHATVNSTVAVRIRTAVNEPWFDIFCVRLDIFICSLTYLMQQNVSWDGINFSADQNIPRISWSLNTDPWELPITLFWFLVIVQLDAQILFNVFIYL